MENAEIDAAVLAVLNKVFMSGEVVPFAMFEDEDTVCSEQLVLKYKVRDFSQLFQRIRGVGKDEVELLMAAFHEAEGVAAEYDSFFITQSFDTLPDEFVVFAVGFYANDLLAAAREQFQRDASRSGKQVERCRALKIDVGLQHIENVFFGEVGRRTRLE